MLNNLVESPVHLLFLSKLIHLSHPWPLSPSSVFQEEDWGSCVPTKQQRGEYDTGNSGQPGRRDGEDLILFICQRF